MPLTLLLNGQLRNFTHLSGNATLDVVVTELGLQSDRVAVELRGEIIPRARWGQTTLTDHDRLELVHFVGGG